MKFEAFISHKAEDETMVRQLCDYLEGRRIHCWISCRDQEPGENYGAQIVEAIAKADAFVLVLSPQCNRTPQYIVSELDCAFRKNTPIIVFRTEKAIPCKSLSLYVASAQWLDAFQEPAEQYYPSLFTVVRRRMFEQHLKAARGLLQERHWVLSVRKCGAIVERAFRELLADLLARDANRAAVARLHEAQGHLGRGGATLESMGLPELVTLYRKADVMNALREHLDSGLEGAAHIHWKSVVAWYTSAMKSRGGRIRPGEARKMYEFVGTLLHECGFAGTPFVGQQSDRDVFPETCAVCHRPSEEGWNYCPECGNRLVTVCESCKRTVQSDWRRCPYCEAPITHRGEEPDGMQAAHQEYAMLCKGAYIDRVVNLPERRELERRRLQLGLDAEEAHRIEGEAAPREIWEYVNLVRGVLVDGAIDGQERAFLDAKARELLIDPWVQERIEETETAVRNGALEDLNVRIQVFGSSAKRPPDRGKAGSEDRRRAVQRKPRNKGS